MASRQRKDSKGASNFGRTYFEHRLPNCPLQCYYLGDLWIPLNPDRIEELHHAGVGVGHTSGEWVTDAEEQGPDAWRPVGAQSATYSGRVQGRGPFEALKFALLRPAACQFGRGALMDRLRHQNFAGGRRRLRPGREVHDRPDRGQVAVGPAELPKTEFAA